MPEEMEEPVVCPFLSDKSDHSQLACHPTMIPSLPPPLFRTIKGCGSTIFCSCLLKDLAFAHLKGHSAFGRIVTRTNNQDLLKVYLFLTSANSHCWNSHRWKSHTRMSLHAQPRNMHATNARTRSHAHLHTHTQART